MTIDHQTAASTMNLLTACRTVDAPNDPVMNEQMGFTQKRSDVVERVGLERKLARVSDSCGS